MPPDRLDQHLRRQADELDRLLAGACRSLAEREAWSAFELEASLDDLWRLSEGRDACYDRPSSGWSYALWYHGRRTHDLVRVLRPLLLPTAGAVRLVDLGAGTGVAAWAAAALGRAAAAAEVPFPDLEIVAAEASQPMLGAATWLWDRLRNEPSYATATSVIDVKWQLRSWTDLPAGPSSVRTVAVAAHLFDASNAARIEEVAAEFAAALDAMAADHLVVSFPSTTTKLLMAFQLFEHLESGAWGLVPPETGPAVWAGPLVHTAAARQTAYRQAEASPEVCNRIRRPAQWQDPRTVFNRLRRVGPPADLFGETASLIRLDATQESAAVPEERLTAIVGAAGSGKSQVLVERVARTVERWRPRQGPPPRVLVTTFNRKMVDQLAGWFDRRLRAGPAGGLHHVGGPWHQWLDQGDPEGSPRVDLVHIDKLAYAAGRKYVDDDSRWLAKIAPLAARYRDARATTEAQARSLRPQFLLDELRRVIAAMEIDDLPAYLAAERRGRRIPMLPNIRELVWAVLHDDQAPPGFPHLRRAWLERVRSDAISGASPPYTHAFVDECQDLTVADFVALSHLVPDPNRIVVTGDETQALHLGASYLRPGQIEIPGPYRQAGTAARRWHEHRLGGSHRLPVRVCEALRPLAERIAEDRQALGRDAGDVCVPVAMKPAVLGTRPVIVARDEVDTVLPQIWHAFGGYAQQDGAPTVTVAEEPSERFGRMYPPVPAGWQIEFDTMLRLKGLERWAVVWRTATPLPDHEAETEWVYTILTRSSGLLIIVAEPGHTPPRVVNALRHLRADRLMFWTERSRLAWTSMLDESF